MKKIGKLLWNVFSITFEIIILLMLLMLVILIGYMLYQTIILSIKGVVLGLKSFYYATLTLGPIFIGIFIFYKLSKLFIFGHTKKDTV